MSRIANIVLIIRAVLDKLLRAGFIRSQHQSHKRLYGSGPHYIASSYATFQYRLHLFSLYLGLAGRRQVGLTHCTALLSGFNGLCNSQLFVCLFAPCFLCVQETHGIHLNTIKVRTVSDGMNCKSQPIVILNFTQNHYNDPPSIVVCTKWPTSLQHQPTQDTICTQSVNSDYTVLDCLLYQSTSMYNSLRGKPLHCLFVDDCGLNRSLILVMGH